MGIDQPIENFIKFAGSLVNLERKEIDGVEHLVNTNDLDSLAEERNEGQILHDILSEHGYDDGFSIRTYKFGPSPKNQRDWVGCEVSINIEDPTFIEAIKSLQDQTKEKSGILRTAIRKHYGIRLDLDGSSLCNDRKVKGFSATSIMSKLNEDLGRDNCVYYKCSSNPGGRAFHARDDLPTVDESLAIETNHVNFLDLADSMIELVVSKSLEAISNQIRNLTELLPVTEEEVTSHLSKIIGEVEPGKIASSGHWEATIQSNLSSGESHSIT